MINVILMSITLITTSRRSFLMGVPLANICSGAHASSSINNDGPSIYFYNEVNQDSCLALRLKLLEKESEILETSNQIPINLHIQSNGGSLTASLAICDLIENMKVPVVTHVEGTVASAASLISVCGNLRTMTKSSTLLLHQPSITLGNMKHNDLQDESYNMKLMYDLMLNIYQKHMKSSIKRKIIEELIETEKVLTSSQALNYGLIDFIIGE